MRVDWSVETSLGTLHEGQAECGNSFPGFCVGGHLRDQEIIQLTRRLKISPIGPSLSRSTSNIGSGYEGAIEATGAPGLVVNQTTDGPCVLVQWHL